MMMPEHGHIFIEDCRETMARWPDDAVDLVITSPPFNVGKDYGPQYDDRQDDVIFDAWLADTCRECERVAASAVYIFISTKKMEVVHHALDGFVQWLFFYRPNLAGGGAIKFPWIPLVTPVAMSFPNGRKPMVNDVRGVNTGNLIHAVAPQRDFGGDLHRYHVAQDPIAAYWPLIARTPGTMVYDPFMGSGTTAVCCEKIGRQWCGSELNAEYVDIANARVAECRHSLFGADQMPMFPLEGKR